MKWGSHFSLIIKKFKSFDYKSRSSYHINFWVLLPKLAYYRILDWLEDLIVTCIKFKLAFLGASFTQENPLIVSHIKETQFPDITSVCLVGSTDFSMCLAIGCLIDCFGFYTVSLSAWFPGVENETLKELIIFHPKTKSRPRTYCTSRFLYEELSNENSVITSLLLSNCPFTVTVVFPDIGPNAGSSSSDKKTGSYETKKTESHEPHPTPEQRCIAVYGITRLSTDFTIHQQLGSKKVITVLLLKNNIHSTRTIPLATS